MNTLLLRHIFILVLLTVLFSCASTDSPTVSDSNESLADTTIPSAQDNDIPDVDDAASQESGEISAVPVENGLSDAPAENEESHSFESTLPEEYAEARNENSASEEKNGENAQSLLDYALELCEESQKYWAEGKFEKSIESLDQAYSIILKLDPEENPELVQPIEDLRYTISRRLMEIYASRQTVVNGFHKEIPLIMNEHVEKEIKSFQTREKKFFVESYKRSGRYREEIVRKLTEAGLPEEISWLPLIESGFKVRALSRARALGLWQFIPSTGYKYGLKRNAWIDERLDPEKSTDAAIAYLKELHKIFGDWATVLAAYNCGELRVLKVIREQKVNYLDDFWDLYQRLPRETARYVPRFLATLHILKEPETYGFALNDVERPISHETVSIDRQVRLKDIAKKAGVSEGDLTSLNPELRHKTTPPTRYYLNVPEGTGQIVLARIDEIPKWAPSFTYHRVRKGETLSLIAKKYGTSIQKIAWANNIRRKHFIRVGQKLRIPLREGISTASYASKVPLRSDGTYRVRKGDSLWLIAQRFKTTPKKLKRINNLKSNTLHIGQVLKIKES